MFAFVSAFPKSLHCTEEAQQAETVLSAVSTIMLLLMRAGEIPVLPPHCFGRCNGFTVTCAGRCIPRLGPCSRSLLSTLLGDALSLAIGQSLLPRWFQHSGMVWCCLAHKRRAPGRA